LNSKKTFLTRCHLSAKVGARSGTSYFYFASGQILIGCEGNEWILPYAINSAALTRLLTLRITPHEVDPVAAKEMIHDTVESPDLTHTEKVLVLGSNAKKFFRL